MKFGFGLRAVIGHFHLDPFRSTRTPATPALNLPTKPGPVSRFSVGDSHALRMPHLDGCFRPGGAVREWPSPKRCLWNSCSDEPCLALKRSPSTTRENAGDGCRGWGSRVKGYSPSHVGENGRRSQVCLLAVNDFKEERYARATLRNSALPVGRLVTLRPGDGCTEAARESRCAATPEYSAALNAGLSEATSGVRLGRPFRLGGGEERQTPCRKSDQIDIHSVDVRVCRQRSKGSLVEDAAIQQRHVVIPLRIRRKDAKQI